MRRIASSLLMSVVLVAGCGSSSEPKSVVMSGSMNEADDSFVLTGAAVDDGLVCGAGTHEFVEWFDRDGRSITEQEYTEIVEASVEAGTVHPMINIEMTCADASGSFVMTQTPTVSLADMDFEGANPGVGTWTVGSGTGDHDGLSGEGTIDMDFAQGVWTCSGELEG